MAISTGIEVYNVDHAPIVARGAQYSEAEFAAALDGPVAAILQDVGGTQVLSTIIAGITDTGFSTAMISQILNTPTEFEGWRIGEALAESFLVDHRQCFFPWPGSRDLKNPSASPAGTDLVGFQYNTANTDDYRFAFAEVKTSSHAASPPSVVTGRHGLSNQIETLRDDVNTTISLFRYLALHSHNSTWANCFKSAAGHYLVDSTDVALFGVIVRDTSPNDNDLASRASALAAGCPTHTSIELRAMYLPEMCIAILPHYEFTTGEAPSATEQ